MSTARKTKVRPLRDSTLPATLSPKALLYPLVILVIFFGVYPKPVFDATAASVDNLVNQYSAAVAAAPAAVTP